MDYRLAGNPDRRLVFRLPRADQFEYAIRMAWLDVNPKVALDYACAAVIVEGKCRAAPQLGCADILFYRKDDATVANANTLSRQTPPASFADRRTMLVVASYWNAASEDETRYARAKGLMKIRPRFIGISETMSVMRPPTLAATGLKVMPLSDTTGRRKLFYIRCAGDQGREVAQSEAPCCCRCDQKAARRIEGNADAKAVCPTACEASCGWNVHWTNAAPAPGFVRNACFVNGSRSMAADRRCPARRVSRPGRYPAVARAQPPSPAHLSTRP